MRSDYAKEGGFAAQTPFFVFFLFTKNPGNGYHLPKLEDEEEEEPGKQKRNKNEKEKSRRVIKKVGGAVAVVVVVVLESLFTYKRVLCRACNIIEGATSKSLSAEKGSFFRKQENCRQLLRNKTMSCVCVRVNK